MAGAVVVVAIVMFTTIGENYDAADLTRIDSTLTQVTHACQHGQVSLAEAGAGRLVAYARRDPGQTLPLEAASDASTVAYQMHSLAGGACQALPAVASRLDRSAS